MTTETLDPVLLQTDFADLELFASGKVRDVYLLGSDHLLFVATDRISAFDYVLATGGICGIKLPAGLRESEELPEPIFTPATKATTGHDDNISFEHMAQLVDPEDARQF